MKSLMRTIQGAVAGAVIAAGSVSGAAVLARQQQEQPSEGTKTVRKAGGVLQGSATRRVQPTYPQMAKAARISGAVVVEITIDVSGTVISASAVSGHPLLKDAAVAAAQQWKFEPTRLDGVPVKVIGTITFNFQMDDGLSIEAAEKELQEHPDSAQAHYDLAIAYKNHGRQVDALPALRDAIRLDPKFQIAYRTLGEYLVRPDSNTDTEGIDALKEAIRLDPHDMEAVYVLASVYTRSKRYDEATGLLKQAIADNPSAPEPYIWLARSYGKDKRSEAEEVLKECIQINPNAAEAYAVLGELYTRLGRTADAISILKQGLAVNPSFGRVHFALGMAYYKSGDKESAMNEYNALKRINLEMAESLLTEITK